MDIKTSIEGTTLNNKILNHLHKMQSLLHQSILPITANQSKETHAQALKIKETLILKIFNRITMCRGNLEAEKILTMMETVLQIVVIIIIMETVNRIT